MSNDRTPPRGLIATFNQLVDSGLAGRLPTLERRVLLVLIRHANREGESWPSRHSIAATLGIGERNVRRAIAGLATRGLVTGGAAGAGRGHVLRRAISLPDGSAQYSMFPEPENGAQDGQQNGAQRAPFSQRENGAQDGHKTGRRMVIKRGAVRPTNSIEQHKNSSREQVAGARGGNGQSDHQALIGYFTDAWRKLHGRKYAFQKKDAKAAAGILKHAGSLANAKAIIDAYLGTDDPFILQKQHPITLLLSQINQFTGGNANALPGWQRRAPTQHDIDVATGKVES